MTLASALNSEQYLKLQSVREKLDVMPTAYQFGCKVPKQLKQK